MGHTLKLILLFTLTLASCANNTHQDKKEIESLTVDTTHQIDTTKKPSVATATNTSNNDTLIIDRQTAVFIEPDNLQIEKRKKKIGEEAFYTGADDYLFYMNTAHEFLDSVKLIIHTTKYKKFIKFICSDNTQQIIKVNELPELWNIFFFDPTQKAKLVDMTIIDEEYKSYFK